MINPSKFFFNLTENIFNFSKNYAIYSVISIALAPALSAATAPSMGTAAAFAVLGGSTVTNIGPTVIVSGNLGVSPGSDITGFPPGIVVPPGTTHAADAVAAQAQSDNTIAYNALAGQSCNFNLTGQDLGGLTLVPGVYCFSSFAQLTGALTLNAQGNPGAVFIFQIGSTLTTASNASVNIINGGSDCNVFWQIGTSATLGTTTSFIGNILALTSITVDTNATISGRALARNGAVTLDSNAVVSIAQCNSTFIAAPVIGAMFGGSAIGVGDSTAKIFTITNPNPTLALTGVGFTDTLPAGLVISTPGNGLTGNCDAGIITATAGAGSVSLAGATLAGGASCTFSVNVTGITAGVKNNSVTVTSTNGGTGNTSTSSLSVLSTTPDLAPPTIAKTFAAASIGVGGTTALTFTVSNPNAAVALTGVAFTDTLPAGLIVSTPGNGLNGTCGGTITATPGSGSVSLVGAALAAGASCTFSINVTGTAVGVQNNSVTVSSVNGGSGNTSTASLTTVVAVVAPPVISKSFGAVMSIPVGGAAVLTFTIKNPNAVVSLTGVAFTDTLPAGLIVSTPGNGLTGSCDSGVITAAPGSGSISLTGATLAAGAVCTFSVSVTVTAEGSLTNTTGNVVSTNGGLGNTTSAGLTVGAFRKGYVSNLAVGDSVLNISNSGAGGAGLQSGTTAGITGSICANIYAFTPDEQMVSCCSCPVTPNGLLSLSAKSDLASNTLTPAVPTALVITWVATAPVAGTCNNSAATVTTATLAPGMLVWGTSLHETPTAGTYGVTELAVSQATLSNGELNRLGQLCSFILANGSGFGVCRSCRLGGLGAIQK